MTYHLVHVLPDPQMHGLNGYREIIKTIEWGLRALGHETTSAVNDIRDDAVNIIFGAQMMGMDRLKALPRSSIIYQLEQFRGVATHQLKPQIVYLYQNFVVWDYSAGNSDTAKKIIPGVRDIKLVPIAYAPILERIPRPDNQDIDVLMYGMTGQERLGAFHALCTSGFKAVFVSGFYGAARDELIARAKVVANVHLHVSTRIFEIVRVSYLLANRKAVIACVDSKTEIEPDIRGAIQVTGPDSFADACGRLIADARLRRDLEERGYAAMKSRAIEPLLARALA